MYFPEDMTFQYFFFDTYIGTFLQVLPIALLAGLLWGLVKYRRDKETPLFRKLSGCAFVCYLTGLGCLVIFADPVAVIWYWLLYQQPSGREVFSFTGSVNLIPDFFTHMGSETIGNFLMFLPFGILHPLSRKGASWKKTVLAGLLCSAGIEILQPIFGRALDVNDWILNTLGVLVSASCYFLAARLFRKKA